MTIHYTGQQGGPYGWGVFGENMVNQFKRAGVWSESENADVIFQPLADNNFTPSAPLGKRNVAMSFFEFELGPDAKANADKFETVFVGSTWCKQRCAERGIHNVRVLIQGVDGDIFKPQPPRRPDGTLRIFSGGKFEYRKGQDLVIAAFKEFAKTHPHAHMVCSWFNPWPQLAKELIDRMGGEVILDPLQFTILPKLSQRELAREMANTDFGLFPNRCEGGNNLVLQEYLSCGRPAAANVLTGHSDIRDAAIQRIEAKEDENHWAVQSIPDIVDAMKRVDLQSRFSPRWTWDDAAKTVLDEIDRLRAH